MGVTFSSEPGNSTVRDLAAISDVSDGYSTLLSFKQCMRVKLEVAAKLVSVYITHVYSPIVDNTGLRSLVYSALRPKDTREDNSAEIDQIVRASWRIFSNPAQDTLNTQELLAVMVLLADAPWDQRLYLLFELFKCMGTDEILHADIQLAAHSAATGLFKLWQSTPWEHADFKTLTEAIADHAYLKMDKELDDSVNWEKFSVWAKDRFRDSRTIATPQSLRSVYESAYK
jgi:hypothetical protein